MHSFFLSVTKNLISLGAIDQAMKQLVIKHVRVEGSVTLSRLLAPSIQRFWQEQGLCLQDFSHMAWVAPRHQLSVYRLAYACVAGLKTVHPMLCVTEPSFFDLVCRGVQAAPEKTVCVTPFGQAFYAYWQSGEHREEQKINQEDLRTWAKGLLGKEYVFVGACDKDVLSVLGASPSFLSEKTIITFLEKIMSLKDKNNVHDNVQKCLITLKITDFIS
ncbi:hypothetical protein EIL50_00295 [bacterium NHP-B]|nr:hypothetical protein EIL50_00295 [bacterium NHP-B]